MGETDLTKADMTHDAIRYGLSLLDKPFFGLLTILYQLFFNVASVELFSESIMKFFGRIQIIIGVYMMFQLAVAILRGIIDPDSFVKNQGGAKGLVPRIIISLAMLALIVPVGSAGGNEFENQIHNQGLLFGTLSSLQYRITKNNTIGRLILGTSDNGSNFVNPENTEDSDELETSARIFASTVLKGFYRINLIPKEDREESDNPDDKAPDQVNAYRMCKSISTDIINDDPPGKYNRIDADPDEIIGLINESCTSTYEPSDASKGFGNGGMFSTGSKRYVFVHIPIISAITAAIFCVILLSFTIDVAVRMIKLAMLRLIAPIPIISYMDPNGSKDGAFSSWWKMLLSTYLDLFVRLASVYFVIFLIQDMIVNGLMVNTLEGTLGAFTTIAVFIGLFAFAKQAPKFFREILGLKGEGGSFFSGLGAAAGIGATVASSAAGMITGWRGSRASQEANWNTKSHAPGETFRPNRGRQVASSLLRGIISGSAAGAAAISAKDHAGSAALGAAFKSNTAYAAAAEDGATFRGKARAFLQRTFTGETQADRLERQKASHEGASKVLSAIANRGDEKATTTNWTTGTASWTNANGVTKTVSGNYQAWRYAFDAAVSQGESTVEFNGETYTMEEANALDYKLKTSNSADYIAQRGRGDTVLAENIRDYEVRYGSGSFDNVLRSATYGATGDGVRGYFKTESDDRANKASQASRDLTVAKANAGATKPHS